MTGIDLINSMGMIDDRFIEEADAYKPKETGMSRKNRAWVLVAASLISALTILLVGIYAGQQENENVVDISVYQINIEDYEIENQILLAYTGNDSIVPIPNEVRVISSDAFGTNNNIKTIVIGANVEQIESGAFLKLKSLEEFLVDENNEYFKVVDGFLIKNDGTLVLSDVGEYGDDRTSDDILYYVNNFIAKNKKHLELFKKIELGSALLGITCEYSEESEEISIYASALEVFGQNVIFDEKQYKINGNQKFQCFETDKYFLLSSKRSDGLESDVFIIYNGGYVRHSGYDGEYDYWGNKAGTYTESVITFYKDNGKLYYHRIPEKFYKNVDQVKGIIMDKCVARDEFYKEVGTVDIIDGKISFMSLEVYTIEQFIDVEKEYKLWCETLKGYISDGLSLDDYLTQNSQKYERAK